MIIMQGNIANSMGSDLTTPQRFSVDSQIEKTAVFFLGKIGENHD